MAENTIICKSRQLFPANISAMLERFAPGQFFYMKRPSMRDDDQVSEIYVVVSGEAGRSYVHVNSGENYLGSVFTAYPDGTIPIPVWVEIKVLR